MAKSNEYNASSIKALDQRTHLLKRMSLTFGAEGGTPENPFSTQKTVAIREITDNAIDEVIGGHASNVRVKFHANGAVEVQDNGRGLPVDIGQNADGSKASGIYLALGVIQSGGKFELDSTRFSSGLNGVGASSTVNTSKRVDITVYRSNKKYTLSFKDGKPGFFDVNDDPSSKFTELEDYTYVKEEKDSRPAAEKKKWKTGTTVKLWLDEKSYTSQYEINRLDITERLRGTTFLIPGLDVEVTNEVDTIELDGVPNVRFDHFEYRNGLSDLVDLNQNGNSLTDVILLQTQHTYKEMVPVLGAQGQVENQNIERLVIADIALSWGSGYDYSMESYVNTIRTRLGGIHEKAFEKAMVAEFTKKMSSMRGILPATLKTEPNFNDFAEGLTAVISIKISEPQFTGQAKEELGGREAQKALVKAYSKVFNEFVNSNKNAEQMKIIAKKVSDATKAREAQEEARDVKRTANKIESSSSMPAKLKDCEITHTLDSELYIVEGDSALGALKSARYSSHQALLPIRGKIVNVSKQKESKVLENAEVKSIIRAFEAGYGKNFKIEDARYGRVFFGTDADVDGGAISVLLLVLFWNYFKPMVEEGRVFQLLTPLFVVTEEKKRKKGEDETYHYALNTEELDVLLADLDSKKIKYSIRRIKGLGEAGAQVLNETAMNPETRIVKRITIQDVKDAEAMLEVAMGKEVAPRKEWIEANPYNVNEIID